MRAFLLLALALSPLGRAAGEPVLDRAAVPSAGRQKALLTVDRFGRYSISVKSSQGTSVQVVDRMAGPRETAGRAGEEDGRLDVFLERGEFRLLTEGHSRAAGEARLSVRSFEEQSTPQPSQLVETKLVESSLDDFEQRSFWLVVKERRRIALEAAGRNLADLRLWRDGQWLVDAAPEIERIQPKVGRPLLACRLSTDLEPGLYLVTAYGGPPQPWDDEGEAHPLYLRFGFPRLPEAGRRRLTVSPFGIDRYLVPGAANYVRLELGEALPATLRAATLDPEQPFVLPGEISEITKKSQPPVAEIDLPAQEDAEPRGEGQPLADRIVTVEAEAGQPYLLQQFDRRSAYSFRAAGDYWISSVHSGHPQDSVDVTALLVQDDAKAPLRESVVEIDAKTAWKRRANLLATLTVFLRVKEAGKYEVLLEGPEARARIEPFLTFRPARYQPPPMKGSGSTWDLDVGFYVLTAEPVKRGIVTFTVRAKGPVDSGPQATGAAAEDTGVRAGAVFPSVPLRRDRSYWVYLNEQPEVRSGVQLRKLPVDPTEPLFVAQRPGETVSVPITVGEPGLLRAESEDGATLDLSIDDGPPLKAAALAPGAHTVSLRNGGKDTVQYSLAFEPARLARGASLPPLPTEEAPAAFETLSESSPRFLDLDAGASATFNVRADQAGLYVLSSTGLLATDGNFRSRVVTSFARESGNGIGRNFELRQYLREGDYQLTVATQAPSAGHLGVQLRRTQIQEGGFLLLRLPARASVKAGEAVSYRFTITNPGEFRVRALGLDRGFRCRLEDEDGWPVVPPDGPADVTRYFEPGRYRFVVLPEATDARVVSVIDPVARRRPREGHGPHPLPLGQSVEHVWLEPGEGQERVPDMWRLDLPAGTDVSFALSAEMEGALHRVGEDEPVASLGVGNPPKLSLAAGQYRLEVRSVRQNNRAPYTLGAFPVALLAGMERAVKAPAEVEVAVDGNGLMEITSFGSADVKARLYDAQGGLVAASDDRPDDWNFQIAERLAPGRYHLRVEPVGSSAGTTSVRVRAPREEAKPALALPASVEVRPGRAALVFPLSAVRGDLLLAQAQSTESLGLSLEVLHGESWVALGSATGRAARIEVPLAEATSGASGSRDGEFRLRVWSQDRRDATARLSVAATAVKRAKENDLRRGLRLTPVAGLPAGTAVARIDLDRPGLFRVREARGLRFGTEVEEATRPAVNGLVAVPGRRLYVTADADAPREGSSSMLRAERVALASGQSLVVEVKARGLVPVEAAPSVGPLVVRARSRSLQPGLRLAEAADKDLPSEGAMAVGPGLAVAVSLQPTKPMAVVFAASPPATGQGGEATLEAVTLPRPKAEKLLAGITDGVLERSSALAYSLSPGPKRLRLGLSRGMAATLGTLATVESVVATDEDASAETIYTSATTLTLLYTGGGTGRYSIEALSAEAPVVAASEPLELMLADAGLTRLQVAHVEFAPRPSPAPPTEASEAAAPSEAPRDGARARSATLHVRGAVEEAAFLQSDGSLHRGRDLPLADAGTLLVRHHRGPLLIWIERDSEDASTLWQLSGLTAQPVELPAAVRLEGKARLLAFERTVPALLQVRSATPLVTVLIRPESARDVAVHIKETSFDTILPAGRSELLLRPSLTSALFGTAELHTVPIVRIGEGLGPEALLPPGSSRAFSFQVENGGPVGVGVRASAAVVEATLLDEQGQLLGSGVTQMPTLEPGRYLLVLHAPAEGDAVRVQPALAGLKQPSTAPPDEVVRRYVTPDTPPATFQSRYVEEAPERGETTEEGEEGPGSWGEQQQDDEVEEEEEEEETPDSEPPPRHSMSGETEPSASVAERQEAPERLAVRS
jgi:hypothetical protein